MNITDANDRKPINIAKFRGHGEVAKLLKNWRAHKANLVDDDDDDED
jgi:hypothetical protein